MRFRFSAIAVSALLAGAAFGQTERVLHFTHTDSPQGFREVSNIIRTMAEIRDVSVDETARTLTLHATAGQIAVSEWLFRELDQNSGVQPTPPNSPMHEYRMPGSTQAVRVYYLAHTATPQGMQEIVNAARSITDMRNLFPCSGPRALALRGTEDQMAMAEWVLNELDQPPPPPAEKPLVHEFHPAGGGDDMVARVFFMAHTRTPQGIQEIVNLIRTMADVQRFYPVNQTMAVVMRGSVAQGALAEWLFNELDRPAGTHSAATPHEYQFPGRPDGLVRVFYVANAGTPQALQEINNQVRIAAQIQRAFPYRSLSALVMRGTAAQIGVAERLINEHDSR